MSLKAKIEAVIYASEEPVTLAQLIGLLGHEAQAELDHIDTAQQSLALEDAPATDRPVDQDALNDEVLEVEEEASAEELDRHLHEAAAEEAGHLREEREHAAADEAAMSTADDLEPEAEAAVPAAAEGVETSQAAPAVDAAAEERRLAREAKEKERRLREYFRSIVDQLVTDYATSERGLEIREVAGGLRMATKPEYHDAVRGFVKSLKPPLKLSLQALETLAVVAYKQPVTAPEVSEIRGVDSGGVLGSLMSRKLVTTAGRKQVIGRPILYKTTRDFLLRFGLKDIGELPSIEEFEKMTGELVEQEEIQMEHHAPEAPDTVEQEKDEVVSQADGDSSESNDALIGAPVEPTEVRIAVDGRISGLPPSYDEGPVDEVVDSPALDAEVQDDLRREGYEPEEE